MDKIQNIKNWLKELVSMQFSESDFETTDGVKLIIKSLEVGSEVFKLDESGNQMPLEDGSYTLKSGEVIEVMNGQISEISTESEESSEGEVETEMAKTEATPNNSVAETENMPTEEGTANTDLESRIDALEQTINSILEIVQNLQNVIDNQNSVTSQKMAAIESLLPGAAPIKTNKKEINSGVVNKSEALADIKKMMSEKNKN